MCLFLNMDQYTPPNILFYSKYCNHCKKFAELLFKLPQINDTFINISVDAKNQRLPSFVQSVPTIVIFDKGEKKILTDADVFSWINQFLENSSKVELVAYDQGSMSSSLSDNFSFIGEEEGTEAEHTFAWMDKLQDTRIGLAPESDSGPVTGSKTMKIEDSQISRYMAERDQAIPQVQKPQENIDFTKLYNQDNSKVDQSVVNQFQQFRKHQVRKGPPPRNGPDFQSRNFMADSVPQSRRGGIVRGGGQQQPPKSNLDNRMEQLMNQRNRDNGSFQQRQTGEYIPLNTNAQRQQQQHQQQQQQRRQHLQQQQQQRQQQQQQQIHGRRPPPNFKPRII